MDIEEDDGIESDVIPQIMPVKEKTQRVTPNPNRDQTRKNSSASSHTNKTVNTDEKQKKNNFVNFKADSIQQVDDTVPEK